MAFLPAVLMAVGTAAQVVGTIKQSQAAAAGEEYNASVAEAQAQAVGISSKYEQNKVSREKRQALSRQRALYAKSGVIIDEGSPLAVMADTATQYEMDINALKYNAAVQQNLLNTEADYRRQVARRTRSAGYLSAGSTLLMSAASMGKMMPRGSAGYGSGSQGMITQSSGNTITTYAR